MQLIAAKPTASRRLRISGWIVTALLQSMIVNSSFAMSVNSSEYGKTKSGAIVHQYVISNDHRMTVKVLDYGGTITQVNVPDKNGKIRNVVLKLRDISAYEARPNFSSIIGRFANRIGGGSIILDGKTYPLVTNASGISSHGGPKGFSTKMWQATTFSNQHSCGVRMSYTSADGENGFPGKLKTTVVFSVDNHDQLIISYEATTSKATVVNFTHHMFFNMDGWGSTATQLIQINAGYYLPVDASKVVTGNIDPVIGTPFDLRKPTPIADGITSTDPQITIADGFDHNFVLDKPKRGELSIAAKLYSRHSGIIMTVLTTEPGVQLFTGNTFNGKMNDAEGRPILKNYGVALETQHFPDSPHHDNFPTTVLKPGEVFRSKSIYQFHARQSSH